MRDYSKVHTSYWTSTTIRGMSEDGRALAMYLLTCPHGTIAGVFRLPDGYVCEDMQWDVERVHKGFAELLANGYANRCETTKWVWISKYLEWNPPENPNQQKAASKVALQVPEECAWRGVFYRQCATHFGASWQPLSNPSQTVSQSGIGIGIGIGIGDKEEANASSSPAGAADAAVPDCPHGKVLDLWAEHCPSLTQPRRSLWPASNGASALRTRWRWVLTATEAGKRMATTEDEALAWFGRFFAYVASCPLLIGEGSRGGWQADLAWCMKAENFAKIMQGNYERRQAVAA